MNICLLSAQYPPETGWGGIGTYTYNLAHALTKLGHEVHVISSAVSDSREYMDEEVHVHRIKTMIQSEILGLLHYNVCTWKKIMELIKRHKINVVEAYPLFGDSLAFSLGKIKPLVACLHTPSFVCNMFMGRSGWAAWRWHQLEKFCLMRADRIMSSTVANAELVSRTYNLKKSKIRIVPHGINPLNYCYRESNLRGELNLVGKKVVLFVGRLEKRKGVHVLVNCIPRIVKLIPDAYFIFVGRDSDTCEHARCTDYIYEKTRIHNCSDHVLLAGYVDKEKLIEYYSLCDVFVAPSLYESFGLVYLEAMACSKPVIGTNVGGIPEVIANEKTGMIVPPEDSQALGDAIINLLTNSRKRKELGFNARKEVEKSFTDISMAKRTLEVFHELV